MDRNEYTRAFAEGYAAGIAAAGGRQDSPVLFIEDVQERYQVGINKAREIMQAIRHVCNGGKLQSPKMILKAEAEYWETLVDKQFRKRL